MITAKKVFYVLNVSEDEITAPDSDIVLKIKEFAKNEGAEALTLCGKIEEELSNLSEAERREFLTELGITEPCLDKMIRIGFGLLGLMTYFTAGEKEIRSWTIAKGTKAPQAAGVIHSDFERGFICAEVYTLEDLQKAKSKAKIKEMGLLRLEGKEYLVKDGDIMEFRFNV